MFHQLRQRTFHNYISKENNLIRLGQSEPDEVSLVVASPNFVEIHLKGALSSSHFDAFHCP
jgi:hypothetical protein